MSRVIVEEDAELFGYDGYEEDSDNFSGPMAPFEPLSTRPSDFTQFAIYVPTGNSLQRFSFKERRYLKPIYDSSAKRKIIMAGRQVEKSTMIGNMSLSYMALVPGFRSLYVTPSHQQAKVFSHDRIKEPMETSPVLRKYTNTAMMQNVLARRLVNQSQMTLRFAFLNADRVRGIPADQINIDEFQDVLLDNIPVIEECASHSSWKLFTYSGTPKSLDGSLEHYHSKYSTQNEWVVPCRHHGTPKDPGSWHWNVLSEDNIGPKGLICDKCGNLIDPTDPDAQWAALNPNPKVEKPFEGFRIPQLMVPWIDWEDILDKQRKYSRAKFYNEVLGRSYDSGTRPLTRADMIDNCDSRVRLRNYQKVCTQYGAAVPIFMGIDWGTGEGTYTVVTMGGYMPWDPNVFTFFYYHKFEGVETEPAIQIKMITDLIRFANVQVAGVDYGGGFWPNDELIRTFGAERVKRYQWVGNVRKKIAYDPSLGVPRFLCHRTEIMSDIFNAIKRRNVFRFPDWGDFEDPFGMDFLNIFSEFNERLRMNVYKHAPGMPDDAAHASIYCFLASMFYRKRPDVILPKKEAERQSNLQEYRPEDYAYLEEYDDDTDYHEELDVI